MPVVPPLRRRGWAGGGAGAAVRCLLLGNGAARVCVLAEETSLSTIT